MSRFRSLVYRWLAQPLYMASLAAAVPGRAVAAEPVGFVWEAPEECPRRSVVLQHLADMLGVGSPAKAEPLLGQGGAARGKVQREGDRWVLELEVSDEKGKQRRVLESEQCSDLAHAAALALALLLEEAAARKGGWPAARPSAACSATRHGCPGWVPRA